MQKIDYATRFHEALSKAFAAQAPEVRAAYFDLACFYQRRLPVGTRLHASAEILRRCHGNMLAQAGAAGAGPCSGG
jgi:hypothetical protein